MLDVGSERGARPIDDARQGKRIAIQDLENVQGISIFSGARLATHGSV